MRYWLQQQGHQVVILTYEKNFEFAREEKHKNSGSFLAFPYYTRHYLLEKGLGLTWFNTRKVMAMKRSQEQYTFAPYNASGCDAIIIGSDEVYSIDVGINKMMYGHDLGDVPAIAYAPSFGIATMEKLEQFGGKTPMGRPGQPAELASIYVQLADPSASYATGQVYGAAGGGGQP
jgi:hypothetical protein